MRGPSVWRLIVADQQSQNGLAFRQDLEKEESRRLTGNVG